MIQQYPKLQSKGFEVYAAGQTIAEKVRARDWEGLQPFLEMKP